MEMRLLFLLFVAGCGTAPPKPAANATYDLMLRGGWIVDGSGNPRFVGDVVIDGDRIVATGHWTNIQARDTIDVTGLIVAPGFIDMLGQSEINALIDNRVVSKVTQGIKTEVTG